MTDNKNKDIKEILRKFTGPIFCALTFFSYSLIAFFYDDCLSIPEIISVSAIIVILLVFLVFHEERQKITIPFFFVLAVSLLIRLVFLFHEPFLSDDIYRYELDGSMVVSGHNPYSVSPLVASSLYPDLAQTASKVNHPDLVTIYPPAAQLVFSLGVLPSALVPPDKGLSKGLGIRMVLIFFDLLTILMISRLLKLSGLAPIRTILYAWNPLVVIETASSGHIDTAAVFFLVLSLYILSSNMRHQASTLKIRGMKNEFMCLISGLVFSLSFLTKLFPLVFLPIFIIWLFKKSGLRSTASFFSGFCLGLTLLFSVFMPDILNSMETLEKYAKNWEFSGFLFRTIRYLTGNGSIARAILSSVYGLFCLFVCIRASVCSKNERLGNKDVYFHLYSLTITYLLLTPTLHPWYAIYLAIFIPFVSGISGICFTFAVLLSYRVLIPYKITGQWVESDLVSLLIFSAPLAAFVLSSIFQARNYRYRRLSS